MNREVADYIRDNRLTYTREAIDAALRQEGYTDAYIQAAWKIVQDEDSHAEEKASNDTSGPRRPASSDNSGCYAVLITFLLLVGVIIWILTNLGLSFRAGYSSSGTSGSGLLWFVNIGSVVVLIALTVVALWLVRTRGWSGSQIAGLVAAVALFWYLVLIGTCLYVPVA